MCNKSMKTFIIIFFLLISSKIFSQRNEQAYRDSLRDVYYKERIRYEDSTNIFRAREIFFTPNYGYGAYEPWVREKLANEHLEKVLPESRFYQDRLVLEKEMNDYFDTCQPIVDERYSYYVNKLSGSKTYKNFLRKLVDFGFKQSNVFTKDGNMIYNYELYEDNGTIKTKVLVQVTLNYAYDLSYEVFAYCF